jgi:hypothetical protein
MYAVAIRLPHPRRRADSAWIRTEWRHRLPAQATAAPTQHGLANTAQSSPSSGLEVTLNI